MTAEKEKSQYIPATISTPSSAVVTSSSKFHPYTHPYACVIFPLHLSSPQSRTKFTHNLHQVTDDKTVAHGESFLPKSLKRQHRFNLSITLKNSGSVARDHLASERTFLAYLRTSLALTSAGVALVQLFGRLQTISHIANERVLPIHKLTHPLGAALVLLGIIVLVFGMVRYFTVKTALSKGMFPATRFAIVAVTFVLAAIVTVTFGTILSNPRTL